MQNGWTPLITAARSGKTEVVAFLLSRGANYKAKNSRFFGNTAKEMALKEGRKDTAEFIEQHEKNPELLLEQGKKERIKFIQGIFCCVLVWETCIVVKAA